MSVDGGVGFYETVRGRGEYCRGTRVTVVEASRVPLQRKRRKNEKTDLSWWETRRKMPSFSGTCSMVISTTRVRTEILLRISCARSVRARGHAKVANSVLRWCCMLATMSASIGSAVCTCSARIWHECVLLRSWQTPSSPASSLLPPCTVPETEKRVAAAGGEDWAEGGGDAEGRGEQEEGRDIDEDDDLLDSLRVSVDLRMAVVVENDEEGGGAIESRSAIGVEKRVDGIWVDRSATVSTLMVARTSCPSVLGFWSASEGKSGWGEGVSRRRPEKRVEYICVGEIVSLLASESPDE